MERADLEQWKAREVARLLELVGTERRYYQEILASIPVGLLVLTQDLTIIAANRSIRKLFDLTGSPLRARLDTLLPLWVLDRVAEVLRTGAPQANILVSLPKTGHRLRIGILAVPSWENESSLEAVVAIEDLTGVGDVTVPVPASVPATSTELLDNLNGGIWTLDLANANFLFVGRSAALLLGYPVQHWISNASFWTDRVHPADRERVTQSYRQAIQRGEGHACEFRAVTADGRTLWVRESARLLTDAEGSPRYVIGITVDVTERRLLQEQLAQSERVQAVSRLAGRMAHDLNNILMIATGHSEELMNSLPANSPLLANVEEILNATLRMSGLTGHLLAFARKPDGLVSTIDLHTVLHGIERRLGLQFKLSTQPSPVRADAEQLEQIVTSLIERENQVAIETSYQEIKEDLRQAAESLRPGVYGVIAITLSDRLFEPDAKDSWFEAVLPSPEKDPSEDWRAAVTRAYGIVREWGGDIVASAAPSGGTVLQVYLESMPENGRKQPVRAAEPASQKPGPATILVVDDEGGIRELVLKILRKHGYQVLEAANGEDALTICREHSGAIDLLITDVLMPRLGGLELVDRLRKQGINPKVLYVSGYTGDANIHAGNFPPGTVFLKKPFTLGLLLERVREVLKARF
jgi:two-component system, cell cycle sensor histidine kinase and response regulator CckA